MTAQFVKYELLVSLLIAVATLGAEQLCALYRWPRRFLWAFALVASLVFPLSTALTTRPDIPVSDVEPIGPSSTLPSHAAPSAQVPAPKEEIHAERPAPGIPATRLTRDGPSRAAIATDRAFEVTWLTLSIALSFYYAFLWLRLRRRIALAPRLDLDGVPVRVADGLGPAVFGVLRPQILVPGWILEAPPATRSLVLEHERQHIAAGDTTLLCGALTAIVLMPWNVVLWWMVQRLRFSLEADCDGRVLRATADARTYAAALVAVCQHREFTPAGSMVLTSSVSWLERRVRIMFAETTRLRRVLAASGSLWALGLLAAAIFLHAPGLAAPGDLRKLPPLNTGPGEDWVQGLARTRFPELFDRSFDGMARLIVVLNQDGSVVRTHEQIYAPDKLPRADLFAIAVAEGLDQNDILASDVVDIRPSSRKSTERALGYIAYLILKWPHDPMRSESRVQAAVEARYPELSRAAPEGQFQCTHLVAVLLNDDGSTRQSRAKVVGCHIGESFSGDELDKLNHFDVAETELGRGGFMGFQVLGQPISVRYTWPRHVDDPPNVGDLTQGRVVPPAWQQRPSHQDTQDDAAIIARYFPDIPAQGRTHLIQAIDGRRYRVLPWILFGRDGHVWQTGRSLAMMNDDGSYAIGNGMRQGIEAHFPGIRVQPAQVETLRVPGVVIHSYWIAPDSPVQKLSEVVSTRRRTLLVNADYIQEIPYANPATLTRRPMVLSFAHPMNFGTPTGIGMGQTFLDLTGQSQTPVTMRVIASKAGPDAVDLELQTRIDLTASLSRPPSDAWVRSGTVRVPYNGSGTVNLFFTATDPASKVQIVLRPQLLGDPNAS